MIEENYKVSQLYSDKLANINMIQSADLQVSKNRIIHYSIKLEISIRGVEVVFMLN